jgi:tRNA1Val (adenine37-N6)-methyltransferase
MKVGTDGVLLGAWCNTENTSCILDVGTGTGLIALMLAQKSDAKIVAIEIDEEAAMQAKDNSSESKWKNRISIVHTSFQDFTKTSTEKFDLIVSNPPFFVNSLKAPTTNRNLARHTDNLSHKDLLVHSKRLLSENGRLCLILPLTEGLSFIKLAREMNIHCHKLVYVYPRIGVDAKRVLLEFGLAKQQTIESTLTIEETERHNYTPEFIELTREFYLKL